MARLSKDWWRLVCPKLWKEVHGIQRLMALVVGGGQYWEAPGASGDRRPQKIIPSTIDTTQFLRFQEYAPFVEKLIIDKCWIPREVLHFLVRQAAQGPLLPNLRVLLSSKEHVYGKHPGWGYLHRSERNDVEDLALLFLSPTLETLAISCNYLAINPDKVASCSPGIKDIRLAYAKQGDPRPRYSVTFRYRMAAGYNPNLDQSNPGVELESNWGGWPQRFLGVMSAWPALSRLTINGSFFRAISLDLLCQLHSLEYLSIDRLEEDANWESMASSKAKFRCLSELRLNNSPLKAASELFRCKPLLRSLLRLSWDAFPCEGELSRSQQHYAKALTRISSHARQLQAMMISSHHPWHTAPFWEDPGSVAQLRSMGLFELYLWSYHLYHLEITRSIMLSGAGPQLRALCMSRVPLPVHYLPHLAQAYPQLADLRIELDASDIDKISASEISETISDTPLQLVAKFSKNGWPRLNTAGEAQVLGDLARYIKAIWRHLKFKPRIHIYTPKREVELLARLQSEIHLDLQPAL